MSRVLTHHSWIVRFLSQVLQQLRRLEREENHSAAVKYYSEEIRTHIVRTLKFVILASKDDEEKKMHWWSPRYKPPDEALPVATHRFGKYEDAEDEYNFFYYAPTIWCGLRALQATELVDDYNDIVSASVNKGITASINAGDKKIRKAVPYIMTGVE